MLNDIERAALQRISIHLEELSQRIDAMAVPYRAELKATPLADRYVGEADHVISVLVDLEDAGSSIDDAANRLQQLLISTDEEMEKEAQE